MVNSPLPSSPRSADEGGGWGRESTGPRPANENRDPALPPRYEGKSSPGCGGRDTTRRPQEGMREDLPPPHAGEVPPEGEDGGDLVRPPKNGIPPREVSRKDVGEDESGRFAARRKIVRCQNGRTTPSSIGVHGTHLSSITHVLEKCARSEVHVVQLVRRDPTGATR